MSKGDKQLAMFRHGFYDFTGWGCVGFLSLWQNTHRKNSLCAGGGFTLSQDFSGGILAPRWHCMSGSQAAPLKIAGKQSERKEGLEVPSVPPNKFSNDLMPFNECPSLSVLPPSNAVGKGW